MAITRHTAGTNHSTREPSHDDGCPSTELDERPPATIHIPQPETHKRNDQHSKRNRHDYVYRLQSRGSSAYQSSRATVSRCTYQRESVPEVVGAQRMVAAGGTEFVRTVVRGKWAIVNRTSKFSHTFGPSS